MHYVQIVQSMTMKRYKLVHAEKDLLEYRIIFINTCLYLILPYESGPSPLCLIIGLAKKFVRVFCKMLRYFLANPIQPFLLNKTGLGGLPWQSSGQDSTFQLRGPRFNPLSGNQDPTCHTAKK